MTLAQQIKSKEKQLKALKNKLPLAIGKAVLKHHKITVTNADGKPVTYTSRATKTNGQTLVRHRKLNSLAEFKQKFAVINKDNALDDDTLTAIHQFCDKLNLKNMNEFTTTINNIANFSDFNNHILIKMLQGEPITADDLNENSEDDRNEDEPEDNPENDENN